MESRGAGTVRTFRNAALRQRNWRALEQVFWGVESDPGIPFSREESGCLFWPEASTAKLYDLGFWNRTILAALAGWCERLTDCGIRRLEDQ